MPEAHQDAARKKLDAGALRCDVQDAEHEAVGVQWSPRSVQQEVALCPPVSSTIDSGGKPAPSTFEFVRKEAECGLNRAVEFTRCSVKSTVTIGGSEWSLDRLLEYACPEPNTGCWLWEGSLNARTGYGMFGAMYAHRLAWEIANGPIPESSAYHGWCVCHRCDTRACCNPDHLLGTHADNMRDSYLKRRAARGLPAEVCPNGHPWNEANTYITKQGWRQCRPCTYASIARHKARKAAKAVQQ